MRFLPLIILFFSCSDPTFDRASGLHFKNERFREFYDAHIDAILEKDSVRQVTYFTLTTDTAGTKWVSAFSSYCYRLDHDDHVTIDRKVLVIFDSPDLLESYLTFEDPTEMKITQDWLPCDEDQFYNPIFSKIRLADLN